MSIGAKGLIAIVGAALAINIGIGQGQSPKYQMKFSESSGAYTVKVELQPIKQSGVLERSGWWGGGGRTRESAVSSFRIFRKGKPIHVPRSAYADLSNINTFAVLTVGTAIKIYIEGGDASAGYDAEITVKGDEVTQRTVRAGEFPDNYWERTTYVSIDPGG